MRESIYDLLRNFRGLEPLKRLFWQELNYDRVNQAISTRAWGDAERQMISGEPLLLAEHGEFKIVYLHMRAGLARDDQRALINRLLQAFPYALNRDSEWSEQKGFRDLGCGAASAIRNPISHTAVDLDFIRERFGDRRTALKFLCLLSLLFEKLGQRVAPR